MAVRPSKRALMTTHKKINTHHISTNMKIPLNCSVH